jgi:hypothetical protein
MQFVFLALSAQGEVYVQFWLREGDAAVEVSFRRY